jgi:peptidoglycan/LPS O-acetylase OafA/YrhL
VQGGPGVASASSQRFESIDILRGFAAISVVVYHVIEHFDWDDFPRTGPLLWFRIGGMGVDLFFVISGFVISLTAFAGIDRLGVPGFRAPFAVHRLRRIVPLYYLTAILFLVLVVPAMMFSDRALPQILSHLFFVHNMSPLTHGGINGPNWSVATEMQLYIFVILLAPWLRSAPWWMLVFTLFGVAWLWRAAVFSLVPLDPATGPYPRFVYCTQVLGVLDLFGVGILLARFVRSEIGAAFLKAFSRYWFVMIVAAASMVSIAMRIYWADATYWPSAGMVVFFPTALALAAGSILLAACCLSGPLWLRATQPLRYLGTISYGIYLWHLLIVQSLKDIPGMSGPIALPVVLSVTLLLASGSWHLFEKPIIDNRGPGPWDARHVTVASWVAAGLMLATLAASLLTSAFVVLPWATGLR